MRWRVLVAVVALAGCAPREAGIVVTVTGAVPGVASLHVEVTSEDSGRLDTADFAGPIDLPTTVGLRLEATRRRAREGALSGPFTVCVVARDSADSDLASACATADVEVDGVTEYTVDLGGVPATDSGTDSGGAFCGDGLAEAPEECDGADLGGADCASLGFTGGALACTSATCLFDTAACLTPTPTIPVLRKPMNAAYVGSVHAPGTLRPTFAWEPSTVGAGLVITYEIDYSTDPTFVAATTETTTFANHLPASDLAVSLTAPVGARYFWRVRACAEGMTCSDYSTTWYVNVGRSDRDFNGDGYADVLVGARGNDAAGSSAGAAYLYFGGSGATLNTAADWSVTGEAADNSLGHSVAFAGDVNADGYADVVVGASFAGVPATGRAYVYLGATTPDATPDGVIAGEAEFDFFGTWVAAAGDVNGDGFADVVVAAPYNDAGGMSAGRAYVYNGAAGALFDETPDATLTGAASNDQFGLSAAGAGDVDGDGFADVVVGAPSDDLAGTEAGRAFLYLGSSAGLGEAAVASIPGEGAGDRLGKSVAGAGDVNGDGFADLVIGAPDRATTGLDAGAAYVFFGGSGALDTTPDGAFAGSAAGDALGDRVASAGDVNGDGFDDVLIAAPSFDSVAVNAGRVFVYLGSVGAAFDEVPDALLSGAVMNDRMGTSVASAGDVNGDSFADVAVGQIAVTVPPVPAGSVHVFFGGSGAFNTVADGLLTGQASGDDFGYSVASLAGAAVAVPEGGPPGQRRRRRPARP